MDDRDRPRSPDLVGRPRRPRRAGSPGLSSVGLAAPGLAVDAALAERLEGPHRLAYEYWQEKRRGGRLPGRADIDPVEIPAILPWVNLIDLLREEGRLVLRHRLVGTAIVEALGRELTGLRFDQFYSPAALAEYVDLAERVAAERRPRLVRSRSYQEGRKHLAYDLLILPLARDGATVDMFLVVFDFVALPDG